MATFSNFLTLRNSNLSKFTAQTILGSTITTVSTATASTMVISSMISNALTLSTLTVSSINGGAPGVSAYSTLNVSSLNAVSSITVSTLTVSSINNNAPGTGTGSFSTLTVSSLVSVSSIQTASTMYTSTLFTTGNMGIGTSTTVQTLTVNGSIGANQPLYLTNQGMTNTNQIQFNNSNATSTIYTIQQVDNAGANYLRAGRNGYGDIVVNSSGYVGIGTASPSYQFDMYSGTTGVWSRLLGQSSSNDYFWLGLRGTGTETQRLALGIQGDPTTGLVNHIQAQVQGNLGWCINTSGYVGIGTNSPSQALHVNGALYLTSNPSNPGNTVSASFWNQSGVGPTISGANFQVQTNGTTPALFINSSQQVGIGTISPNITLDAWGTSNGIGRDRYFGSQHAADKRDPFSIGRWDGTTSTDYFLGMRCNVDTYTNAGFGSYNNQAWLSFYTWGCNFTDPAETMRIRGDGIIMFNRYPTNGTVSTTGSNGTITVSSDRRIKEGIVYIDDTVAALDQINHLKPATFRLIGQPDTYLGFIAQDVEQYIPLAVDGKKHEYQWETDEKGNPKFDVNGEIIYKLNDQGEKLIRPRGLTDRAIIAVQTLAIQELAKQVTSQSQTIQELSLTATSSAIQIQEQAEQLTQLHAQLASLLSRLAAAGI